MGYRHDGELHHHAAGSVQSHAVEIGDLNPAECTPEHDCDDVKPATNTDQTTDTNRPHGDHVDYLVDDDHRRHPHRDQCDHRGPIELIPPT
jgi:hypothetical protein